MSDHLTMRKFALLFVSSAGLIICPASFAVAQTASPGIPSSAAVPPPNTSGPPPTAEAPVPPAKAESGTQEASQPPEVPNASKGNGSSSKKRKDKDPAGGKQPTATDLRAPYIIGPEDVLLIRVWAQAEFSGPVVVGPDGMISVQLIGDVKADGLTTGQLKAELEKRLAETALKNPEVTVQVQRVNSRKYTIQGEVNHPGTFPLTGPMTVLEALVAGGGFHDFANPKRIYILRFKPDGSTEKLSFNYKDVSHGKHMEQNIYIQNGDHIFVP